MQKGAEPFGSAPKIIIRFLLHADSYVIQRNKPYSAVT